jgi:hypothetical protein
MSPLRPRSRLETHDVSNQPPPFEEVNLFSSDLALRTAVVLTGRSSPAAASHPAASHSAHPRSRSLRTTTRPPQCFFSDYLGRGGSAPRST